MLSGGETGQIRLMPMEDGARYCDHCGQPLSERGHQACREARALDPPRYCPRCGRRMVVKVTPGAWSSHCPRHGPQASDPGQPPRLS
jgi:NADH pyrophosphatase NudC (nudix superfamily)